MTELEKELMKEVEELKAEIAYAHEQINQLIRHSFGHSMETTKEEKPD